jgi:integrase/recombinase XerD
VGGRRLRSCFGADTTLAEDNRATDNAGRGSHSAPSACAETNPACFRHSDTLLVEAIVDYLTETQQRKSRKTLAAYAITLYLFCPDAFDGKRLKHTTHKTIAEIDRKFPNKPVSKITRKDLLDYAAFLQKLNNSPRTVRNRIDFLQIFLHHYGVESLLNRKDLPTYTKKKVRAYSKETLEKLFADADQNEKDLLHFFLCTGVREQEAQYICWSDVDLDLKTYTVTQHLDLGYRPKDKEEEALPFPDVLVEALKARRVRYPESRLILPGEDGKPDGHRLRTIKRLALRAGLNCGECVDKAGKSCTKHPVCKQFVLHKLRKTFATNLHPNGFPAQTLQR